LVFLGCFWQGVLSICFELTLKLMSQLRSNFLVDSLVFGLMSDSLTTI
jgi:hypothetical protein